MKEASPLSHPLPSVGDASLENCHDSPRSMFYSFCRQASPAVLNWQIDHYWTIGNLSHHFVIWHTLCGNHSHTFLMKWRVMGGQGERERYWAIDWRQGPSDLWLKQKSLFTFDLPFTFIRSSGWRCTVRTHFLFPGLYARSRVVYRDSWYRASKPLLYTLQIYESQNIRTWSRSVSTFLQYAY